MPDPARNDGLATGLSLASNSYTFGMDFVGITCAACHVSELRYGGKTIRVDGAPNMINLQVFYAEAIAALFAIRHDTGKLWRMLKRLGRQDFERYNIAAPFVRPALLGYYAVNVALHREKLKARVELIKVIRTAKELREKAQQQGSKEPATSGFGRLDAFDGTRNFLLTRLRKEDVGGTFQVNTANMVKLNAPTKFPQLWSQKAAPLGDVSIYDNDPTKFPQVWGFKDYTWLEWTLNTDTVLERNFTETLGAGATVVLDPAAGASLFNSSISINNLHDLEWLTYYIDPPRWPAELFGPVDAALVERGKAIYRDALRKLSRLWFRSPHRHRPAALARLSSRGDRNRSGRRAADLLPGPQNGAHHRAAAIVDRGASAFAEGLRRRDSANPASDGLRGGHAEGRRRDQEKGLRGRRH